MRITAAQSTDLFTGSPDRPLQVVRVTVAEPGHFGPAAGRGRPNHRARTGRGAPAMAKRSWSRCRCGRFDGARERRLPRRWCSNRVGGIKSTLWSRSRGGPSS